MRGIFAGLLLAGSACASVPAAEETGDPSGSCSVGSLQELVGQAANQALATEALQRSGARSLRWIRPGDMVTMDYSGDRLNIHLDAEGRVERFACG